MTVAELIRDLFQSNKEKLKYPIFYTYLIVLILWNWDVLSYYFISDSSIEEKIACIKSDYSGWDRVYCPLAYAIFISLLLPYLMFALEWCLQWGNKKRKEIIYHNNRLIREEKLNSASYEFLIEQEKTGKRDLEQLMTQIKEANEKLEIERKQNEDSKKFFEDTIESQKALIKDRDLTNENLFKESRDLMRINNDRGEIIDRLQRDNQVLEEEFVISIGKIDSIIDSVTGNKIGINITKQALSLILENVFLHGLSDQARLTGNIITDLKDVLKMRIDNTGVHEVLRFFNESNLIAFVDYKKQLTFRGLKVYNHLSNLDIFDNDPPF